MKTLKQVIRYMLVALLIFFTVSVRAQQTKISNIRPYDKEGLNMFEVPKSDTLPYTGFKVRFGLNTAFQFQNLSDVNAVDTNQFTGSMTGWNFVDANKDSKDDRQLLLITNGFNLAMANLNLDAQLYDGIHMNLVVYLSSRHHSEAWVKGGYVQFDKLTFLKSDMVDKLMNNLTIKFGDYEVNYGDQHFRRSDGGNTMYNPFVENLIMDQFTTEIGGELDFQKNGFLAVFEMTGGEIKGDVNWNQNMDAVDSLTQDPGQALYPDQVPLNKRAPSIIGKIGFDKQLNTDLRVRLTGSVYTTNSSTSNTIFGGDRTGSRYFAVVENSASSYTANPFSGRFNPAFTDQVTTFMINPFVKYHGLELFATLEFANGRQVSETEYTSGGDPSLATKHRTATQYAVDLVYRFGKTENFWVAGRYNTVTADPRLFTPTGSLWTVNGAMPSVSINRYVVSAGWYIIDNIMVKAEYVNQMYNDFPTFDIRNDAKFNGVMIEASLGF